MVLSALSEGLMTREEVERVLGEQLDRESLSDNVLERKSLARLSVEERRQLLSGQVAQGAAEPGNGGTTEQER